MAAPSRPPATSRPWRARAFHLTRNRDFLLRGVAIILTASAVIALAANSWRDRSDALEQPSPEAQDAQLHESLRRLAQASEADPTRLAAWIRMAARHWMGDHEAEDGESEPKPGEQGKLVFLPGPLQLADMHLEPVLLKHAGSAEDFAIFADYVRCRFGGPGPELDGARERLEKAAGGEPPRRFSREFYADVLLLIEGNVEDSLKYYLDESSRPEALHARKVAYYLALKSSDKEAINNLVPKLQGFQEIDSSSLMEGAILSGNKRLLGIALLSVEAFRWSQPAGVFLAVSAAGIWYVILLCTGTRERWRWFRYLPAILAGIASVWVVHWLQATLRYDVMPEDSPTLTHEFLHWILYVGLPEETCKLALFSLFIPWLLRQKSARKAALVAGCVGLGFALDENLQYLRNAGIGVITGRLLTANFLHVCLTGILGWHLYELFRSRFNHATTFLTVFAGACVAHGLYNFSGNASMSDWGVEIASIVILALGARMFLQLIHSNDRQEGASPISRTCVFWFGSSFLTGALMVTAVIQSGELRGITETLKGAISLVPVAFIYLREFDEVR